MVIPIDQAVTSFEALMSTIEKDRQVYCWFAHLIRQAPLRERLSGEEDMERSYRALDRIAFAQRLLYMLFGIFLGAFILTGSYVPIRTGLIALLAGVYMHLKKKKIVAGICSCLFLQDFEKFLFAQKTLYQIGEWYSQEYKIFSLVDVIAFADRAAWGAFIITLFVTCFIYPLNPATILLAVAASFYIVRAVVNTPFVYKYIQ